MVNMTDDTLTVKLLVFNYNVFFFHNTILVQ